MPVSAGTAVVDFEGRFDGLTKDVNNRIGGMKSAFSSAFKGIALSVGGIFAAKKGFDFFGDTIEEAREAAKVTKLTNQVLESTKGAANIGAEGVGNLANRLSALSGIDDEIIQSGENVLLTFTNIKNGAGKGNDIFNQATEAALNMSAALGTDLQGSVIQVGKALNDPIKGVTALQRVGVSFTAAQKDQIKALVASGKTMEAQKLILRELSTEFGGAAAAAASPAEKFKVAFGNLKEQIGTALLPIIDRVLTFLASKMPAAIAATSKALKPVIENVKLFVNALTTGFTEDEGTPIENFALLLRDKVLPVVQDVVAFLRDNWKPVLAAAGAVVLALASPFVAVVGALALLYLKFQFVRDVVGAVVSYINERIQAFAGFVREIFPQVQEAIGHFVSIVQAAWRLFGDDILNVAKGAFTAIKAVIEGVFNVIAGIIRFWLAVFNGDWGKAWDALKGIVSSVFDTIKGVISGAFGIIKGIVGGAVDGLGRVVSTGLDKVVDFFAGMGKRISTAASGMFDGIKNAFKAAFNWIIDKWNGLEFKLPSVDTHIPGVGKVGGFTLGTPDIPRFHSGGLARTDMPGGELLALLRDGERVLTPEQNEMFERLMSSFDRRPIVLEVDGRELGRVNADSGRRRRLEYA